MSKEQQQCTSLLTCAFKKLRSSLSCCVFVLVSWRVFSLSIKLKCDSLVAYFFFFFFHHSAQVILTLNIMRNNSL